MSTIEYGVSVDYTRPDGTTGGIFCSADNLSDAVGAGIKNGIYYRAMYAVVELTITERCVDCKSTGRVAKKRSSRLYDSKKCPTCKGKHTEKIVIKTRIETMIGVTIDNGTGETFPENQF